MWAQIINTLLGIWIMASPDIITYNAPGKDSCHIAGPLVATFALIACWEATRGVRKFNLFSGLWLLTAPILLGYTEPLPIINDMASGTIIIVLSLIKGKIKGSYGGGWNLLRTH